MLNPLVGKFLTSLGFHFGHAGNRQVLGGRPVGFLYIQLRQGLGADKRYLTTLGEADPAT
jgi:hypothetical protein